MKHRNLSVRRDAGLRRLSRLTWRATLLSVVAAFGLATLFARTAAHSAAGTTSASQSSTSTSGGSPSPSTIGVRVELKPACGVAVRKRVVHEPDRRELVCRRRPSAKLAAGQHNAGVGPA